MKRESQDADLRSAVSDAYAKAVSSQGSCCGSGPVQKGVAAQLAGYTAADLDALPPDAVVNSFGCGNPLAFGEVRQGDVVLDLGSGAGIDILIAAKKVGPSGRAIGIDMTDEMLSRARENIAAAGLTNAEVRKGIIEALPVESSSVDWVISNCVINLSPNKPKVFAEIARVLRPGGRMRVSDIVVRDFPEELRTNQALYSTCIAGAISEEEYVEGLRNAGMAHIEVRERIHYDEGQIGAFVESDLADGVGGSSCCGTPPGGEMPAGLASQLAGRVWSAVIVAEKAAASGSAPD